MHVVETTIRSRYKLLLAFINWLLSSSLGPVMTKFTIALREIGTYKEVLRSQVITLFYLLLQAKGFLLFLQSQYFGCSSQNINSICSLRDVRYQLKWFLLNLGLWIIPFWSLISFPCFEVFALQWGFTWAKVTLTAYILWLTEHIVAYAVTGSLICFKFPSQMAFHDPFFVALCVRCLLD